MKTNYTNLNSNEIRISNYCVKENELKDKNKTEKLIHSKINLNKTSFNNNCSMVRISLPLKRIKYNNNNINTKKIKINPKIYLSPNSKSEISYLNHFNNNSIYYSNYKKKNTSSNFRDSKLNTEAKITKMKIIFPEKKIKNTPYMINFQKTNIKLHRKELIEDSKNNDSIYGKNDNFIPTYRFLPNYNTERSINELSLNTSIKPEITNKKLLKIISKKDIFNSESNTNIMSQPKNVKKYKDSTNIKNKIKIQNNPEIINPEEYIKIKKIGEGSFGEIFKVKWIKNNKNYAMKEMRFQNEENLLALQKKLFFINDFGKRTNSKGLIKIYGYTFMKKKNDYYFYEIMELAEKDWEQEIIFRQKYFNYYTEKELFSITKQLIKVLSLLQQNHITHRDIKLQNILLVNNKYKLCDFGESRNLNQKGIIVQPVRGSELYMSPILFLGLNNKLMYVTHNTYKSDMFSLGMCILFAATLDCECLYEIRELNNMNEIRKKKKKYLKKRYSDYFIEILLCMLEVKEKRRPDFIQLEKVISSYENMNIINI